MADSADLDMLMSRLAEGDRDAFSPLFRALWPPALKVCERMLPEADAADAAQGAMLKILERANEYDRARPALPWALGIAAWEC
ncbi:MAG: sigma-70 family RNA polymerase sigma factor, partial [Deltaproteobacteria bacterium]|nr:sigma-70 family RNA polymerase sigma factor [Deltaproteobacteria bacterium]